MAPLFLKASVVSKEQLFFFHSMFSLSSYCDMNTLYCSQYRCYNKEIPSNLHDRHWEFVLHKQIPSNLHDRHWEFVLRCLERRKISLGSDCQEFSSRREAFFQG